jgi:hypothetical protein
MILEHDRAAGEKKDQNACDVHSRIDPPWFIKNESLRMNIPNYGWALGFGIIGFGVAYIIDMRLTGGNTYVDLGIGAIVGGLAWLVKTLRG